MEDKHKVAKERCLELMKEKEKLKLDLPQVQQNLESLIALNTSINTAEGLDGWQTLMQQTVEELTTKKKDYLDKTKEFEEIQRSWKDCSHGRRLSQYTTLMICLPLPLQQLSPPTKIKTARIQRCILICPL